jgi:tetratricopeptide (TPR) repeat protein
MAGGRVAAALFTLLLIAGFAVHAQPTLRDEVERATALLEAGRAGEAKELVDKLEAQAPRDRQLRFLKAHLALGQGQRERAIGLFRDLLSEDPSLIRVRLDLARTLYEVGEYDAATYHFELALGSNIPDNVRRNVQAFLDRLRHAETYASLSASFARDTNANQGPRSDTVYLFGLPFTLAQEAQARRATALVLSVAGRLALGEQRRSYLIASLDSREYSDERLTYRLGQAGFGHSVPLESWRVGAEAGVFQSYFQRDTLSEGPWARVYAWGKPLRSLIVTPSLQRRWNEYPGYSYLSGKHDVLSLDSTLAVSPSLAFTGGASLGRSSANDPASGFDSRELRVGASTELPLGFIVGARLAYSAARHHADDLLFATRRRDRQRRVELEVSQRGLSLWRFAPTLFLSHVENDSSIGLYTWQRRVAGLGLTTRF